MSQLALILGLLLAPPQPLQIGSRLELFVDDYLIDTIEGLTLQLHSPQPAGRALAFDQPWEGNTSAYATVIKDDARYRMYYRGSADPKYIRRSALKPGEAALPPHPEFTCYAESPDGIHWTKPVLGLVEFNGSKANNILWTGPEAHDFAPFLDANPAAKPAAPVMPQSRGATGGISFSLSRAVSENGPDKLKHIPHGDEHPPETEALPARYKAFGRREKGLIAFQSADGLNWTRIQETPVITDGAFDSLNVGFWDATRNHYVAVYRDFRDGVRTFKSATSQDFLHWTPGQWADFGGAPVEQLYTNAATPYFRAPHIYLAFPKRFFPDRTRFEDTPSPGISEAVFISSRDGLHWDRRFMEAFIRPGRDERNWVHRNNMVAAGVVPTAADEISLYVSRHYTYPSAHMERMVLRTDGFVSLHARFQGGELLTKPILIKGDKLVLNYATSAAGSIRFEIQSASGQPLPRLALRETPVLWGDAIDAVVPLATPLAGVPIRLRFVMKDADLYSVRFRD